jgi:hypothetical protein
MLMLILIVQQRVVPVFLFQVKIQAKEIYEKYFKAAQAQPRGVVAKLGNIVAQIERACQKQVTEYLELHLF